MTYKWKQCPKRNTLVVSVVIVNFQFHFYLSITDCVCLGWLQGPSSFSRYFECSFEHSLRSLNRSYFYSKNDFYKISCHLGDYNLEASLLY